MVAPWLRAGWGWELIEAGQTTRIRVWHTQTLGLVVFYFIRGRAPVRW